MEGAIRQSIIDWACGKNYTLSVQELDSIIEQCKYFIIKKWARQGVLKSEVSVSCSEEQRQQGVIQVDLSFSRGPTKRWIILNNNDLNN